MSCVVKDCTSETLHFFFNFPYFGLDTFPQFHRRIHIVHLTVWPFCSYSIKKVFTWRWNKLGFLCGSWGVVFHGLNLLVSNPSSTWNSSIKSASLFASSIYVKYFLDVDQPVHIRLGIRRCVMHRTDTSSMPSSLAFSCDMLVDFTLSFVPPLKSAAKFSSVEDFCFSFSLSTEYLNLYYGYLISIK